MLAICFTKHTTYEMVIEHANIFMKRQQDLRIIKFGIYTEIENARYLFCDDANSISCQQHFVGFVYMY